MEQKKYLLIAAGVATNIATALFFAIYFTHPLSIALFTFIKLYSSINNSTVYAAFGVSCGRIVGSNSWSCSSQHYSNPGNVLPPQIGPNFLTPYASLGIFTAMLSAFPTSVIFLWLATETKLVKGVPKTVVDICGGVGLLSLVACIFSFIGIRVLYTKTKEDFDIYTRHTHDASVTAEIANGFVTVWVAMVLLATAYVAMGLYRLIEVNYQRGEAAKQKVFDDKAAQDKKKEEEEKKEEAEKEAAEAMQREVTKRVLEALQKMGPALAELAAPAAPAPAAPT